MTRQMLALRPLDGLFFRDDRPFNQDDEGLAEARTVFPPFPTQLAGGVRAAMASAAGWDGTKAKAGASGEDPWDDYRARFGDGMDGAGELRFGPPMLLRRGKDLWDALYPLPTAALCRAPNRGELGSGKNDHAVEAVRMAGPGDAGAACDLPLGPGMSLPAIQGSKDDQHFEQLSDCWITTEGLRHLLRDNTLSAPQHQIWTADWLAPTERRIGLQRDHASHRAVTGMLYTAAHRRLKADYALGIACDWADGRDEPLPSYPDIMPLGGHSRAAAVEPADGDWLHPAYLTPEKLHIEDEWAHVMIVLLSPCTLDGPSVAASLGGELVSACVGRPLIFGGWNVIDRSPIRRFHRAGSTFFLRIRGRSDDVLKALRPAQEEGLGGYNHFGCGAFAIGTWKYVNRGGGDG